MAARKKGPKVVTDAHKEALATGRRNAAAVRAYLDALEAQPRRSRTVSPDELRSKIDTANDQLAELTGIKWVEKRQEVVDLEARLAEAEAGPGDLDALEAAFIQAAKPWAEAKGISRGVLREAGVPASVLKDAGL